MATPTPPDSISADQPRPRRWKPSIWQIVAGCFFLVILLFVAWRLILIAMVDREIARIKAEGYPTTRAEWNAYYKTPAPGKNAAIRYESAFTLLTRKGTKDLDIPNWSCQPIQNWETWPHDHCALRGSSFPPTTIR